MNEKQKEGRDNRFIYKSSTAKVTVIPCDFNYILHFTIHKNCQKEERQCILIIVFGRFSSA